MSAASTRVSHTPACCRRTLHTGAGLCGAAGGEPAAGRAPGPGRGGQGEPAGGRAEQGRHAAQQVQALRPRPRLGRARWATCHVSVWLVTWLVSCCRPVHAVPQAGGRGHGVQWGLPVQVGPVFQLNSHVIYWFTAAKTTLYTYRNMHHVNHVE